MSCVQALAENNGPAWPSARELEQWLTFTAGESDLSASSLRKLLQTNAGYSKLLVCDEDFASMAQLFAKRFRSQIQASESPIQTSTLFRPLCEVIWRTTAHVIVSLSSLGDAVDNMHPLLPKDAHGQLRALLKTLEDLNCKFCEARRNYLRELSMHRDKQRRITESAQRVLDDLEERPVMFYEPLDSVLDAPTKEFVRLVVEERIKEGLQVGCVKLNTTVEMPSKEHNNAEVNRLQQEVRQLRVTLAKGEDAQKRLEQAERRAREEAAATAKTLTEALNEAHRQLEQLKEQAQAGQARRNSVQKAIEEPKDSSQAEELVKELRERLAQREKLCEDLQQRLEQLKQEQAMQESQLASEAEHVKGLREQLKQMAANKKSDEAPVAPPVRIKDEEALMKLQKKLDQQLHAGQKLREANLALERALKESEEHAKKAEARAVAAEAAAAADAARARSAEAAEAAAKATATKAAAAAAVKHEAPPARQEAAAPAQAAPAVVKVVEVREVVKVVEVQEPRTSSKKSTASNTDSSTLAAVNNGSTNCIIEKSLEAQSHSEKDMEEEIRKATLQLQHKVAEQAEEIGHLKAQLYEMASTAPAIKQDPPKSAKQEPEEEPQEQQRSGSSSGRMAKCKAKCQELQERCEALQEDKERLEAENASLTAALKESCSEEKAKEVLSKIKMEAPPPSSKRKKKAFERLYDDAQRRILDMKSKGNELVNVQKWVLADAAGRATDQLSLQSVNMLMSLQEASEATNMRFQDAVSQFQARLESGADEKMPTVDEDSLADSSPVSRVHSLRRNSGSLMEDSDGFGVHLRGHAVQTLRRNSGSFMDDSEGPGVHLRGHVVSSRLCPTCRQPLPSAERQLEQRPQEWPGISAPAPGSSAAQGPSQSGPMAPRTGSQRDLRLAPPGILGTWLQHTPPPVGAFSPRTPVGARSVEAAALHRRAANREPEASGAMAVESAQLVAQRARSPPQGLRHAPADHAARDHQDLRDPAATRSPPDELPLPSFLKDSHLLGLNSLPLQRPNQPALDADLEHGPPVPRPQQGPNRAVDSQALVEPLRILDQNQEQRGGMLRQAALVDPARRQRRAQSSPAFGLLGSPSLYKAKVASPKHHQGAGALVGIAGATNKLIGPASPLAGDKANSGEALRRSKVMSRTGTAVSRLDLANGRLCVQGSKAMLGPS